MWNIGYTQSCLTLHALEDLALEDLAGHLALTQ